MNKEAMSIAVDLIIDDDASTLCDGLGLDHEHIYNEQPRSCPECSCIRFRVYEVLGDKPEPIIWECKKCQSRFPKYDLVTMEELLSKVSGLWTNPQDWSTVPKKDYN